MVPSLWTRVPVTTATEPDESLWMPSPASIPSGIATEEPGETKSPAVAVIGPPTGQPPMNGPAGLSRRLREGRVARKQP